MKGQGSVDEEKRGMVQQAEAISPVQEGSGAERWKVWSLELGLLKFESSHLLAE
jgi:hypothetical protein